MKKMEYGSMKSPSLKTAFKDALYKGKTQGTGTGKTSTSTASK